MTEAQRATDSSPDTREVEQNFEDVRPPLRRSEALIEADRCYFCYDAPCTTACPTGIDIPGFIQQIRSDNIVGSAQTILSENIMGGMCARVCPTEVLCEEACVRQTHEDLPVRIGLLQRHATDPVFESQTQLFSRQPDTGYRVAVVGGGPAGLSCAHRLACLGHKVTLHDAGIKAGGLNEYGIAAYKTVDDFAQREVEYILSIGGIEVHHQSRLGATLSLGQLRADFDAVFLGIGLEGVNELRMAGEHAVGAIDAVKYIAELRQATDKSALEVARNIVVIGGGMTAVDIAVQSKLLGAESVTIAYRRDQEAMSASHHEQTFAQTKGVRIRCNLQPAQLVLTNNRISGVEFEYTRNDADGSLTGTGETCTIPCETVFKAIGQKLLTDDLGETTPQLKQNRIVVDQNRRTSIDGVWAGGDCVHGGEDLTVAAIQDGKLAAQDIHQSLMKSTQTGGAG